MNTGLNGAEAAEAMAMPPALEQAWHTHGYYGSVSHNVKAVYQRYLGWFDGNPGPAVAAPAGRGARPATSSAWAAPTPWSPRPTATPTGVTCASPPSSWTAWCSPTPTTPAAKEQLADVYDRLAYGAENGTWRNFYLMGAHELRHGMADAPPTVGSAELLAALTVEQLLDAVAIRIVGPRAWDEHLTIDWRFTDLGVTHRATLRNGVLTHRRSAAGAGRRPDRRPRPAPRCSACCSGAGSTGSTPRATWGASAGCSAVVESPGRPSPSSPRSPDRYPKA